MGFAWAGHILFGYFATAFSGLGIAFVTMFISFVNATNLSKMKETNTTMLTLLFLPFLVYVYYILLNLFLAILLAHHRDYIDRRQLIVHADMRVQNEDFFRKLKLFLNLLCCRMIGEKHAAPGSGTASRHGARSRNSRPSEVVVEESKKNERPPQPTSIVCKQNWAALVFSETFGIVP